LITEINIEDQAFNNKSLFASSTCYTLTYQW